MWSFKMFALFLMVLSSENDMCNCRKILGVFPSGAKSHFVMTGKLMKALAERGHQVDVIGMFPLEKPMANYRDIVLKTDKVVVFVDNVTYGDIQVANGLLKSRFVRTAGLEPCDSLGLPSMQEVLGTEKGIYGVIIVELFLAHCYLALGQHLDAPIVGVVTSKLPDWLLGPFGNHLNPSYIPSLFSSASQRMTFWERLQNTLMTNIITPQINYYMEAEVKQVEKYFGRKLSSMNDLYKDVALILVNEHYSLDDIKPLTPDIIGVGGLHVVDDDQQLTPDLQKWLDESTHGCVYFTFGSMVKIETFPEAIIKIFYEMFERIAPVRVLIKIVDPKALPPGLPNNVKTSLWLPQVAILKHKNVKLFITHGGLMGTQEAIAYKVPMVGLPLFGDQHTNIQSYANKKIAIALNLYDITADSLTNAVKTVLNDPIYRNNIEKMSKLFFDRPMNAIDTAVYWVEYTAKHGTVLKSPATELTWWQFYLLDVYGFILSSLLLTLYIIKMFITFFWKAICPRKDVKTYSNGVSNYKKTQ
ncbi:UDP-glucuronosyltransferase [Diachasma alloeum]|uniref:UDP-glucuronosyltransferase n=1 Tax=Diachasma alloeum TaxID=454923 RepID=UPI0007384F0E|nr:UDP-glucuronosyltransferase [Diachasma alloeum]